MPEYQFPQFEIGGAQPQASVLRHAAYNTLPHQAVQPWRRTCSLQLPWDIPVGDYLMFYYVPVQEQVVFVHSIQTEIIGMIAPPLAVLHGHRLDPSVLYANQNVDSLDFSVRWLKNQKTAYEIDHWTMYSGLGYDNPAPLIGGSLSMPDMQEPLTSECHFGVVVEPATEFKVMLTFLVHLDLSWFSLSEYSYLMIYTTAVGRSMPKSLYDQFIAENGGR